MIRNNPSQSTPLFPKRGAVNQNSHTAVASIGKPIATLNFSIHAPGFGRNFNHAGCQQSTTNGAARPRPVTKKINSVTTGGCVKAKARAALRNGAVQGV